MTMFFNGQTLRCFVYVHVKKQLCLV